MEINVETKRITTFELDEDQALALSDELDNLDEERRLEEKKYPLLFEIWDAL